MKQLYHFLMVPGMISILGLADNSLQSKESIGERSNRQKKQPNVIFFAMDDLNDWVTPMGYNQAKTPNMDRLAKEGVVFTYAHAPGVTPKNELKLIIEGDSFHWEKNKN